jgi:signal peptidase I
MFNKKLFLYLFIFISIFIYIINVNKYKIEVVGDSMSPTYKEGDILYFNKYNKNNLLNKNDIILFNNDTNKNFIIKRVVGIEDDIIEIKNNILYINNIEYNTYISNNKKFFISYKKLIVKKEEVFVIGDNFYNSLDSKILGCISTKDIKGYIKERGN